MTAIHATEHLTGLQLAMPSSTDTEPTTRTITGIIVPFDVIAERTSLGQPVKFLAGCLKPPADLSRVKLLMDHDHQQPVGVCTHLEQSPTAALATFKLPDGATSDAALASAASGLRDGLSVGVSIRRGYASEDGSHFIVAEAVVDEVSLVALPAFTDARITQVRASITPNPTPDPDQEPPMSDTDQTDDQTPDTPTAQPPAQFTAAPAFQATPAATQAPDLNARFAQVASLIQAGKSASEITAALADVTPAADKGGGLLTTQELGELWTAHKTTRYWIERASTMQPLTSGLKQRGWAWKIRPVVADYEGNKTEIAGSPVETQLFETDTLRMSGGWDIDRIYVDLADGEMLRSIADGAVVDYQVKTDAKQRAVIVAAATAIPAPASLPAAIVEMGQRAAAIGSRLDYIALAPDVWSALAMLTRDEIPWWLSSAGLIDGQGQPDGARVWVDPGLARGQIVAGDKRATIWREKNPPVRIQAVDLPRGGVDIAVFGYYSQLISEPKAIFKGTVPASPAP